MFAAHSVGIARIRFEAVAGRSIRLDAHQGSISRDPACQAHFGTGTIGFSSSSRTFTSAGRSVVSSRPVMAQLGVRYDLLLDSIIGV